MAKPSKETKRAPKKAGKKPADKRLKQGAKPGKKRRAQAAPLDILNTPPPPPVALGVSPAVLDRLWGVVMSRRDADPAVSHSARLLSRGITKVAQKFGEEAVECLIEAVAGNRDALIGESADVLYHLIVIWVAMGVRPDEVWTELQRREGISGVAEKASRAQALPVALGLKTTKIP
jgi:phosphoribosyl-ATP pyrophosphohydrolase